MTVTLIYGPPCAGKSTLALELAGAEGIVVDHDLLAQQAGSDRSHNHDSLYRDTAEAEWQRLVDEIAAGSHRDAWVVRTAPHPTHRADLARYLGTNDVRLVIEPREVLLRRAQDRYDPIATVRAINRWFDVANPRPKRAHPAWSRR